MLSVGEIIEKINTIWPQDTWFWPKINNPSSFSPYIHAKLHGKDPQTAVKFLIYLITKTRWLDLILQLINQSVIGLTDLGKNAQLFWPLGWKTSHLYAFYPFDLPIPSDPWHTCQRVSHPAAFSPSWWSHQMETLSALLAICAGNSPVPGEFPTQRPVTRSFDVFFDLSLNERLNKQSWSWRFETQSRPLWCHSNDERLTGRFDSI